MFLAAMDKAVATLGDVADGIGVSYRLLHAMKRGDRRMTPQTARRLVRYLRQRSAQIAKAADKLERALGKGGAYG